MFNESTYRYPFHFVLQTEHCFWLCDVCVGGQDPSRTVVCLLLLHSRAVPYIIFIADNITCTEQVTTVSFVQMQMLLSDKKHPGLLIAIVAYRTVSRSHYLSNGERVNVFELDDVSRS